MRLLKDNMSDLFLDPLDGGIIPQKVEAKTEEKKPEKTEEVKKPVEFKSTETQTIKPSYSAIVDKKELEKLIRNQV